MNNQDNTITVGIIIDKRGDPPYVSVNKLWKETADIIAEKYNVVVFEVDSYYIENDDKYKRFVEKIDLLFLLSPYYTIDRSYKEFPVVFYGLGSLQKGGAWLVDNHDSFRSYDKVILNCTSCMNIFEKLVKEQSLSSVLIPFGVDTDVFLPSSDKAVLREKYNIPKDSFVVVYSGRINHQKNPTLLLSALRDLKEKYSKLFFMFIGSFDNFYIPEFNENKTIDIKNVFLSEVEEYELSSCIALFKTQDNRKKYSELLSLADIGINVTTLISENFGYTPVEMQACGLPVIGTSWGGLKDTIIDGETGFLIETVHSSFGARINFEQLKNRIELLINDDKIRKEMSLNARKNAEKNYSSKLFSNNINNLIKETLFLFKSNRSNNDYYVDISVKEMSRKIHCKYPENRHVSWEHLHPELDYEFYEMISSECAEKKSEDTVWFRESVISKGFDWELKNGRFVSFDSRWNTELELWNCHFSEKEKSVMENIISGETLDALITRSNIEYVEILDVMNALSDKGLVIPWNTATVEQTQTAAFVIPHYNTGNNEELFWLEKTLNSVKNQTDKDWKIIIVDDASPSDYVKRYLKKISVKWHDKMDIIFLRKNKGPGNARNIGILRAAMLGCPFVLYLDSDDIAASERLEKTRKAFMEHPAVGVVYSSFDVIDENGRYVDGKKILPSIQEIQEQLRTDPPQGKGVWRKIALETGYINLTSSTAVRTDIALKYPFPQERVSEDYYTWLMYSASGWEYMYLDSICTKYRIPQSRDGSRARNMMGGNHLFNLRKSIVDVKGFQRALELACHNGEIKNYDKSILMISFLKRKAESMIKDGEDEIANEYYKKADRIEQSILRA